MMSVYCKVVAEEVRLHRADGSVYTAGTRYNIVREDLGNKVIRSGVCPSRVDALCAELNKRIAEKMKGGA